MENPTKMDDLGVPLFAETPIYIYITYIQRLHASWGASQGCGSWNLIGLLLLSRKSSVRRSCCM